MMNPIYPCLWLDGKAAEAAAYYCAIFPNSKITESHSLVVRFELNGNRFMGLNGGPHFSFNETISFVIECETQEEIDHYWAELSKDGVQSQCGWLKDRYGVSWQVVPAILASLMNDPATAPKTMERFMKMSKFDIAALLAD